MDYAHKETDKEILRLEQRMKKEYRQAYKECKEKFEENLKQFQKLDKKKLKDLEKGLITQKQYIQWRKEEILISKRYKEMVKSMAHDYMNANKNAVKIINGKLPDIYAMNHNYSTYMIERQARVNTSYTLYDRDTVSRLFRDKAPYTKAGVKVASFMKWNSRRINSVITQGILQGKSIPDIAKDLQKVADMNYKQAVRTARTMVTGAENSGRQDSYERALDMGIDLEKMWISTHDDRTRDSHVLLDREVVAVNERFSNGLIGPGDKSTGDPSEYMNCRCSMVSVIDGVEYEDNDFSEFDYEAWKQRARDRMEKRKQRKAMVS